LLHKIIEMASVRFHGLISWPRSMASFHGLVFVSSPLPFTARCLRRPADHQSHQHDPSSIHALLIDNDPLPAEEEVTSVYSVVAHNALVPLNRPTLPTRRQKHAPAVLPFRPFRHPSPTPLPSFLLILVCIW